jgi:hypothetical protein
MGINDDVWDDSRCGLGHVFWIEDHAHSSFLTVAGRKFIADLWNAVLSHPNLRKGVSFAVPIFIDFIHISALIVTWHFADIS